MPFLLIPPGSDRPEVAGSSRCHVGDGVLAAWAKVSIILRPDRFAGRVVTTTRGFATLMAGRQG
jgi:hypothetical protein